IIGRSLDVSSLEEFAEDGTVNRQLGRYFAIAGVDDVERAAFRAALQRPAPIDPVLLSRVLYTNIGDDILTKFLGDLLRTEAGLNGKYSLRAALILAAQDEAGLSTLNFLRYLPTDMRINLQAVLSLSREVRAVVDATKFSIETLERLSTAEAQGEQAIAYADLPQLDQPGEFGVESRRWEMTSERQHPISDERYQREFYVDVFRPEQWRPGKTPVIVFSHGLSSNPEYFSALARHMTSHGYVVAMPQHPGSDAAYRDQLLKGLSSDVFEVAEFVNRPQDISAVIDELERRNGSEFDGRLDLEHVGVGGHSFGGYTALAVAGATIDFDFLSRECGDRFGYLNTSLLLQCQALELPHQSYDFRDDRVQSVAVMNPVNSSIYGPEGLSQVQIPTIILSGSHDPATPAVFEQFRTFPWVSSSERYLGLIEGQAHIDFSIIDVGITDTINSISGLTLADPKIVTTYAHSLGLAFFEVYAAQNDGYRPYLQATYADFLSQDQPFPLYFISEEMTPALEAATAIFGAESLND
ncbi:MAG: alpha/beta hydrolase, partial [Elainellaceae cyanobacterium]